MIDMKIDNYTLKKSREIGIFLFLLHNGKDFRHEERNNRDKNKEDNFPFGIKKNSRYSKTRSEDIDNIANICMSESEFKKSKMEVVGLVSLHRIFSLHDADAYDIYEIDKINTDNRHRCGDFSTRYDCERSDKKSEDDRPRITHDASSMDIMIGNECRNWYKHHYEHEDKLAIFHSGFSGISEVELQSEESEDDKADERKTRCEAWNPIRKINTIKY